MSIEHGLLGELYTVGHKKFATLLFVLIIASY